MNTKSNQTGTSLQLLAEIAAVYFSLDFVGFIMWSISGQVPQGYYIGMATGNIVHFITSITNIIIN